MEHPLFPCPGHWQAGQNPERMLSPLQGRPAKWAKGCWQVRTPAPLGLHHVRCLPLTNVFSPDSAKSDYHVVTLLVLKSSMTVSTQPRHAMDWQHSTFAFSAPCPFRSTTCYDHGAQELHDGAVRLQQLVYIFLTRDSENLIKCSLQSVFLFLSEGIHKVAGESR